MASEADHIADNYGHCVLDANCTCLKKGWRGRLCQNWRPVTARTWEELRDAAVEAKARVG